jgi:hypothetical protein
MTYSRLNKNNKPLKHKIVVYTYKEDTHNIKKTNFAERKKINLKRN